jgi:outer membrane protein TolC
VKHVRGVVHRAEGHDVHLASLELVRQIADAAQVSLRLGRVGQQDVVKSVVELTTLRSDIVAFRRRLIWRRPTLNVLLTVPRIAVGARPRLGRCRCRDRGSPAARSGEQPELRRAHLEVERGEAELASTRQEIKPDFSVQGGYMVVPRESDALMAKFGISWPNAPWSRGKIDARVAAQTAAIQASKARARAMENGVRLSVQEAYVRAASAQERAALLKTTVLPEVRHALDVSRIAYQSDRDEAGVLIEPADRAGFRAGLLPRARQFDQALADLESATGSTVAGESNHATTPYR